MSVSIGLSRPGPTTDADHSQGVGFDDDGYYWFLYPFFESVWKQTGQMVDPYGDAVFEVVQLPILLAALEEAIAATKEQPEEWDVRLGWRGEEQVFCKVSKVELERILADFINLTKLASKTAKSIVCVGD